MYSLSVQREFVARHCLVGGDWGSESEPHPHEYRLEVRLESGALDRNGFLIDLVRLQAEVDRIVEGLRGRMLNDLPEFAGLNPSLENFARVVCSSLKDALLPLSLHAVEIRIWEDASAWASYRSQHE